MGFGLFMLSGVFSLTGVFPWFLGTFRTIDLTKVINQNSAGFVVYLGTPVMILAAVGLAALKRAARPISPGLRTALVLVFAYFVVICSTPLLSLFYLRSAGLGVLGLVVLRVFGVSPFFEST
jgi:hypothetical protein